MKIWDGHLSLGRLTIYGNNAMHWGARFHTKRWGYICFRLPFFCNRRWVPLYLYVSPNATPWAATFMIGKKHNREAWAKTRLRRFYLGHNFKYDSDNEDLNWRTLRRINDI